MKPETPLHRALRLISFAALGLALAIVAACATALPTPELTPTPTRTPRPTVTPVPPTPSPSPTPAWPVTVYIPQGLPAPVADSLNAAIAAHPDLFSASSAADGAEVEVHHASDQADASIATWTYALVAPFPTIVDEVAWEDFTASWSGQPSGPFAGQPLLMSAETAIALNSFLNQAAEGSVEILPEDQIAQQAWDLRPSWAVVPFEQLDPRWKVLRISGMSLLHKDLDAAAYPLVLRLEVSGLDRGVSKLQEILAGPIANRDPSKMTTVLMTGVTALVRGTAAYMGQFGMDYPARDILPILAGADIQRG